MLIKSLRQNAKSTTNNRYFPTINSATNLMEEDENPEPIQKYLMKGITFAPRQPKEKYFKPITASHEIGWHLDLNKVKLFYNLG